MSRGLYLWDSFTPPILRNEIILQFSLTRSFFMLHSSMKSLALLHEKSCAPSWEAIHYNLPYHFQEIPSLLHLESVSTVLHAEESPTPCFARRVTPRTVSLSLRHSHRALHPLCTAGGLLSFEYMSSWARLMTSMPWRCIWLTLSCTRNLSFLDVTLQLSLALRVPLEARLDLDFLGVLA